MSIMMSIMINKLNIRARPKAVVQIERAKFTAEQIAKPHVHANSSNGRGVGGAITLYGAYYTAVNEPPKSAVSKLSCLLGTTNGQVPELLGSLETLHLKPGVKRSLLDAS